MGNAYVGKQLSQPVTVNDLFNGQSVTTMQQPYLLTEADFLRLKGSPPITATLATIVFSGTVGYALSLGPKITPMLGGGQSQLTSGEINTMIAGTILSFALYIIGFCLPNDKKNIMKKITRHFDNAPPSSHIVGDPE